MTPVRDGLRVLRQLRQKRNETSVLPPTADGRVSAKAEGCNLGGDEYIVERFAMDKHLGRARHEEMPV